MSCRLLLPSLLTLSALGLAACGEDTTQPNSAAEPNPGAPEFALVSNTWRTRADMWGVERSSYAAVNTTNVLGQTIVYVIDGRSLAGNPLGNVMAYNVYTNTWTVKAPLPVPLYATNGAGAINGKLYISGGCRFPSCTRNGYSPALYMYDPTTNAWTRKSDMPDIGGYGGVTGVLGGKLYVLTTCIDVLDPAYYECEMLRTDKPARPRLRVRGQSSPPYHCGSSLGRRPDRSVAPANRPTVNSSRPRGIGKTRHSSEASSGRRLGWSFVQPSLL